MIESALSEVKFVAEIAADTEHSIEEIQLVVWDFKGVFLDSQREVNWLAWMKPQVLQLQRLYEHLCLVESSISNLLLSPLFYIKIIS